MPSDPHPVTIGVAIQLPGPIADDVRELRRSVGDPQADVVPPHITLVPPVQVPAGDLDQLDRQLAESTRGRRSFHVDLRGTGTFRPVSPVVFLDPIRGGRRCTQLHRAVSTGQLAVPTAFPYRPHVTIAHLDDDEALDHAERLARNYAARFLVDAVALYLWHADQAWQLTKRFPLADSSISPATSGTAGRT